MLVMMVMMVLVMMWRAGVVSRIWDAGRCIGWSDVLWCWWVVSDEVCSYEGGWCGVGATG